MNDFLRQMEEALSDEDYGDGDYGRFITGGHLWILAEAPDRIRELYEEIAGLQKALGDQVEMVRKWKNRESRCRDRQRKLLERFGLTRETMDSEPQ